MSLFIAIKQNNLNAVIQLLIRENINIQNVNGFTPLNWAIFLNRIEIVSYLLDHKANVNLPNNQGMTPLHYACSLTCGSALLVTRLLAMGATVNVYNKDGWSPLYIAMMGDQYDIMTMLLDRGIDFEREPNPIFCEAINTNNRRAIDLLLKYDINFNLIHYRYTSLHLAIQLKDFNLIIILLERGADPNLKDKWGNTALHLAVETNDINIVATLLKYIVDVNCINSEHKTSVCLTDMIEIIELLCKHGADLNIIVNGSTSFLRLWSFHQPNDLLVETYLKYNANPNIQDLKGRTVLHYAVENKQTNIVKQLLEAGADFELRDYKDISARDIAVSNKRQDIVELFEEYQIPIKEPIQ
jgi:ankyrin repeat protein